MTPELLAALAWADNRIATSDGTDRNLPELVAAARAQAEGGAVPREPTKAMLDAVPEYGDRYLWRGRAIDLWRAMYDAAPSASEGKPNYDLPDVIERAVAWLRSLQFGQPDAYNCADLLEQAARHAATEYTRGAEDMRKAAAKHIEGGRAILDIQVSAELLRDCNPAAVVQLISADAEAATRHRIVKVIRALPLPEPPK